MKKVLFGILALLLVFSFMSTPAIAGNDNGNGGNEQECVFCPSGSFNFGFVNQQNSFGANQGFSIETMSMGEFGSTFTANMYANGLAGQSYLGVNLDMTWGTCTDCGNNLGGYLQVNTGGLGQYWDMHSVGANGSFFNAGQSQTWNFGQYQGGLHW